MKNKKVAYPEQVIKDMQEKIANNEKILIEYGDFVPKRTLPQNAYLHVIFSYIADKTDTWYSADDFKEIFKYKFLKRYSETFWMYVQPTHTLDKIEMIEFIEKIKLFCLDFFKLEIPNPEDKRMLDYYNFEFKKIWKQNI